jgi:hypothetical protein
MVSPIVRVIVLYRCQRVNIFNGPVTPSCRHTDISFDLSFERNLKEHYEAVAALSIRVLHPSASSRSNSQPRTPRST